MKTLNLILKKKWYDLIEQGIKTEEYREIKPYYKRRIVGACKGCKENICYDCPVNINFFRFRLRFIFDKVRLRCGYSKKYILFYVNNITIDKGKPEWGAEPDRLYFVIKLGKRIK